MKPNLPVPYPRWRVVRKTKGALTIRDIGPWKARKTINECPGAVVRVLIEDGTLGPKMRLFFYDRENVRREIRMSVTSGAETAYTVHAAVPETGEN